MLKVCADLKLTDCIDPSIHIFDWWMCMVLKPLRHSPRKYNTMLLLVVHNFIQTIQCSIIINSKTSCHIFSVYDISILDDEQDQVA